MSFIHVEYLQPVLISVCREVRDIQKQYFDFWSNIFDFFLVLIFVGRKNFHWIWNLKKLSKFWQISNRMKNLDLNRITSMVGAAILVRPSAMIRNNKVRHLTFEMWLDFFLISYTTSVHATSENEWMWKFSFYSNCEENLIFHFLTFIHDNQN